MTDFDRESMLEMFIFEMSQLIDQLESTIVQSESEYNSDQINEIFRIMHTIKGSSAMMMYDNISNVSHAIEDLFYYLREESPKNVDFSKLSDYVLAGADFVKGELNKLQNGEKSNGDGESLSRDIEYFLRDIKKNVSSAPPAAEPLAPAIEAAPTENISTQEVIPDVAPEPIVTQVIDEADDKPGLNNYEAVIFFQDGCEMENIRAFTLVHNLGDLAVDVTHVPKDIITDTSIGIIRENGFLINFFSEKDYDTVYNHLSQTIYLQKFTLEDLSGGESAPVPRPVEPVPAQPSKVVSVAPIETPVVRIIEPAVEPKVIVPPVVQSAISPAPQASAVLKEDAPVKPAAPIEKLQPPQEKPASAVDVERMRAAAAEEVGKRKNQTVNSMISVNVSKLDALLNIMSELVMSEAMVTQNPDLEGLQLENFEKDAHQLRKIISNLQQTVMSMRMVPVSATFFKMHRIVRDMCRQLGKDVHLEVVGEETEVDKNIIEQIADPIMHIIRNSIDHGIESKEDREKAAKPKKAVVHLEARNSGGDVLIIIRDDGCGINTEKVLKKARENDLLSKPDYEYSEKEIQQFIFLPGFSTNEAVTAFSGRGVGMDVVSSNLSLIGGSALVDSVVGEGTTFTLKIPLTLAIIEGMSVLVAGAQYTIPIVNIIKSFKATPEKLFTDPSGNEMITERGEIYNIVRMHEFFNIEGAITDIVEGTLVMIENGDQVICLLVDMLIGQQQAVLKPMPKYFKKVQGLGGCTLLGNGDISLIVDVPGFFD